MQCQICLNQVDVLAHAHNVEFCLICMAEINKYAMNYGKSFEYALNKKLAKVGA